MINKGGEFVQDDLSIILTLGLCNSSHGTNKRKITKLEMVYATTLTQIRRKNVFTYFKLGIFTYFKSLNRGKITITTSNNCFTYLLFTRNVAYSLTTRQTLAETLAINEFLPNHSNSESFGKKVINPVIMIQVANMGYPNTFTRVINNLIN